MTGFIPSVSRQCTVCSICAMPVPLETCNADEHGIAVHEACYVRKTISTFRETRADAREDWLDSVLVWLQIRSRVSALPSEN